MTNPSLHLDFHSTFPVPPIDDPYSLKLLECNNLPCFLKFNLPNSKFDDSPVSNSKFSPTLAGEEASEDAVRSKREAASGSASPLKEARRRKKSKQPVYKGVRKRQEGKWVSEIREPGKKSRIWLGTFPSPHMAARAYDVAAFTLKTPYAYLNFPEAVSSLPVPLSRSPKAIQAAASMAAAVFRGSASDSNGSRIGGLVATSQLQVDQTTTLSSTSMPMQEQVLPQSPSSPTTAPSFLDEDIIFDMPNVLADMAQGLMITPPLLYDGTHADNNYSSGHGRDGAESSLWNI